MLTLNKITKSIIKIIKDCPQQLSTFSQQLYMRTKTHRFGKEYSAFLSSLKLSTNHMVLYIRQNNTKALVLYNE